MVTPEEETLILNLAKEEGISENDAKIYLIGEKKRIKEKRDGGGNQSNWKQWKAILGDIGKGTIAVFAAIGTVLAVVKDFNDLKDNKFRSKKIILFFEKLKKINKPFEIS